MGQTGQDAATRQETLLRFQMKAGNLIQVPTKGLKQLLLRSSAGPLLLPVGCGMQQDEVSSCGIRKISAQSTVSRTSMAEARKLSAMSSAMVGVDNSDLIVPAQSMSTGAAVVERRLGSLQEQELQQAARSLVPRLTHSLHKGVRYRGHRGLVAQAPLCPAWPRPWQKPEHT